jgi:hypothetical protein
MLQNPHRAARVRADTVPLKIHHQIREYTKLRTEIMQKTAEKRFNNFIFCLCKHKLLKVNISSDRLNKPQLQH